MLRLRRCASPARVAAFVIALAGAAGLAAGPDAPDAAAGASPLVPRVPFAPQARTAGGDPTPFSFTQRRATGPFNAERLQAWATMVNRHVAGADDRPAAVAAQWTTEHLSGVFADLLLVCDRLEKRRQIERRIEQAPPESRAAMAQQVRIAELPGWVGTYDELAAVLELPSAVSPAAAVTRFLERAALLHTDVALLDARTSRRTDAAVVLNVASVHHGVALALVDRLRDDRSDTADAEFARRWYVAVAVFLQSTRDIGSGPVFLQRALRLFPTEPRLHFVAGVLNEFLASPWVQGAVGLKHDYRLVATFADELAYLERAERYHRQAALYDPAMVEARLRAAHVAGRRGDHQRAMSELKAAEPLLADPRLRYYFWLFIGEEQNRTRDCAGATRCYRQALALFPRAQAAQVSLSHALRQCGDTQGAIDVLEHIVSDSPIDDPWDDYFVSGTSDLPILLRELWQAARSGS